ncbi:MAG TPA: hypothetical protein VLF89_09130 [Candidatus Saccharimonadales bacterium]|nr:hypothetical protein [Candidatus Saccharimonadales bacterium]
MLNTNVTRINITIPEQLNSKLEKKVAPRGKSQFISEAIEEKLIREERDIALKELRSSPPAFPEIKDGATYVRELRENDEERRKSTLHK